MPNADQGIAKLNAWSLAQLEILYLRADTAAGAGIDVIAYGITSS